MVLWASVSFSWQPCSHCQQRESTKKFRFLKIVVATSAHCVNIAQMESTTKSKRRHARALTLPVPRCPICGVRVQREGFCAVCEDIGTHPLPVDWQQTGFPVIVRPA